MLLLFLPSHSFYLLAVIETMFSYILCVAIHTAVLKEKYVQVVQWKFDAAIV